jgi:DNA-binding NtrC family response regulator
MALPVVLVVDDETAIAETHVQILRLHSYAAVAYTNPVAALSAVAELKPDLLLTDFQMPTMNGLDLALELLKRRPTCKVLIISGAIRHARNHPAVDRFELVEKPIPVHELLTRVSEMLNTTATG